MLCNQLTDDNNLTNVYLAYTAEGAEQAMRPQTAKSGRPKTASKGRSARRSALSMCYWFFHVGTSINVVIRLAQFGCLSVSMIVQKSFGLVFEKHLGVVWPGQPTVIDNQDMCPFFFRKVTFGLWCMDPFLV